ncbi:hypothetical protein K431DRAFT_223694 [Polychaeton citri CBS 116435]|uniref:Uncharacterized protein n=1 Tax=Polychaeton citri CBS 116435 TaxID=1314669 RepID=A0A9P4UR28_9PEZI|nr:hypothetical protein K431DRAFT_223694 [Polychaeton citri CBS 116435]
MKRNTFTTASRAFPIVIASVSLTYNVFAAVLCQYLPDDPLYIGASISVYAWSGSVLSLLGLCGIIWRRPVLVTSFAHFLLLDTLMSALSRILTLELALDSFSTYDDWHEPDPASTDVVAYARWQQNMMRRSPQTLRCDNALSVMRVVAFGVLFCVTVLQGMLAVAMRRYSRALERDRRMADVEHVASPSPSYSCSSPFRSSSSSSSSLARGILRVGDEKR